MTSRQFSLENILAGMDLDIEGKLKEVETLLQQTPNNPSLLILKGRLLSLSKDQAIQVADIEKCFFGALSADQESLIALSELAHLYSIHNPRKAIIFANKCLDQIIPMMSEMSEIISSATKELFVSRTWIDDKTARSLMATDLLNQAIPLGLGEDHVLEILGSPDRIDTINDCCSHGSKKQLVYEIPDTCPRELRLYCGISGCICCFNESIPPTTP